jgi:hypothetical protein
MGKPDVEVKLDDINIDVTSESTLDADLRTELVVSQPIRTESAFAITEPIVTQGSNAINLDIQPIRTESNFAITEPIVSENSSDINLDVKPLVADLCFKLEIGKLPDTCIRRPYQHHFGITLFGVELFGFNFAGEAQTVIENIPKQPQVIGGGQQTVVSHRKDKRAAYRAEPSGGLRIRLQE